MTENKRKPKSLNDYQHARLRTEMYLGSRELHTENVLNFNGETLEYREFTWVPALFTALRELIDNSLDEMSATGVGDTLRVDYNEDERAFSVEDNGTGIPIYEIPEVGKGPAASLLLAKARSGANFEERGEVGGANGLGAACTNFTSEWFQLDVWQKGQHFRQKWTEGTYRQSDVHKTQGPNITDGSKTRTGTRVMYKPSEKVFKHFALPLEFVLGRMWDISVANPGLKVYFNGVRLSPASGRDPVIATYFKDRQVSAIPVNGEGFNSTFYVCTDYTDGEEIFHTVVNNIPAFVGGTHIDAFRNRFYGEVSNQIAPKLKRELKKLNVSDVRIQRKDLSPGVLIFNITKMNGPSFNSQTKEKLITETAPIFKDGFSNLDVGAFLRRNGVWVDAIIHRYEMKLKKKANKDTKDKSKRNLKRKVANMMEAVGSNREDCIMFLAEGESAISGMANVRDPDIHGGMGLRGKILNVNGVPSSQVMSNTILTDIMAAFGLQIGEKADPSKLNYGKCYMAMDEDEDGKNILTQVVNFFNTYWPELLDDPKRPFLYKFCTPFIILEKGDTRHYIYAHDYEEYVNDPHKFDGWSATRAKGLGTLEMEDWAHALYNPVLIPIVNDGGLTETLDLIFSKDRRDDRKVWLTGGTYSNV